MNDTHRVPAVYMRGGKHRGVFFHERDLPRRPALRDALLLRILGAPDPQQRYLDGVAGAARDAARAVIIAASARDDCDIDFEVGVASTAPLLDFSHHCVGLTAAAGAFAIDEGMLAALDGSVRVRMWQRRLGQRIDAIVPVRGGRAVESGAYHEDGVPFPSSEIRLEHLFPGTTPGSAPLLPTGRVRDQLSIPGVGAIDATLIGAPVPLIIIRAEALGLTGRETPAEPGRDRRLRARIEAARAAGASAMDLAAPCLAAGLSRAGAEPWIAWAARPRTYRSSAGVEIGAELIDVLARVVASGVMHESFPESASVSLAAAAALPGSVVNELARTLPGVATRIGHVSGTLAVGAEVSCPEGVWRLDKAVMSRSARRLMSGWVHVPAGGPGAPEPDPGVVSKR